VLTLPPSVRIFLAVGATDLRKGFDSLAAAARDVLRQDPLSGHVFAFCNRRRTRVRLLLWDGTGMWLMTKRLEAGTFAWPRAEAGIRGVTLRSEELAMLLGGLHAEVTRRPGFERRPA
jgi:transposase